VRVLPWLAMILVACSGNSSSSTTTAAVLIDVHPITITFGGRPIAKLLADGRTEAVGENPPGGAMSPGPTLHADGTIQLANRDVTARIAPGGDVYVAKSGAKEQLFGHISGDHLAIEGKNGVHVDGAMMTFDDGRDDVGKIEGVVDPAMRHTALVMLAGFFIEKSLAP
jgi:hypothetical protein